MSDPHMTQLLQRIEEYHLDEKRRWRDAVDNESEILAQVIKERNEANALLREVLRSLSLDTVSRLKEIIPELEALLPAAAPSAAPGVEE